MNIPLYNQITFSFWTEDRDLNFVSSSTSESLNQPKGTQLIQSKVHLSDKDAAALRWKSVIYSEFSAWLENLVFQLKSHLKFISLWVYPLCLTVTWSSMECTFFRWMTLFSVVSHNWKGHSIHGWNEHGALSRWCRSFRCNNQNCFD